MSITSSRADDSSSFQLGSSVNDQEEGEGGFDIYGPFSTEKTSHLMDEIANGLSKLGLTHCQAKVYAAALKLGAASARDIAKQCSLDRGSTYHTIEELVKIDLLKMELGTPNLYAPRNPEKTIGRLLGRYKYELDSKIKTANLLSSEAEELKRNRVARAGPSSTTSYRLERNRAQASREFHKFLRETKGEVLFIGPARSLLILGNQLEMFKDACERGVVWRYISEVNETNKYYAQVLSKYCEIRQCQRIPMLMTIFDRKVVLFGATPNFLANSEYEDETHFLFEDPRTADVFALMFENLWKNSKALIIESRFSKAKGS